MYDFAHFGERLPAPVPSSLILSSITREADSTGTVLFMSSSNSRGYFSGVYPEPLRCAQGRLQRIGERAQRNLQPPQMEASSGSIAVRKDGGNPRAGLIRMIGVMWNA